MSVKILACPYCGSDCVDVKFFFDVWCGKCINCSAAGPEARDKSDAILLWNAAANALAAKDAEIADKKRIIEDMFVVSANVQAENLKLSNELQLEKRRVAGYKWQVHKLQQEIAEHRRHVATVMKRETVLKQELEKANGLIGTLGSQPDGIEIELAKAIAERDALAVDFDNERYKTSALEREIERLRDEMHSQDEALADAQDKRDKYYADWYAEHCRVEASDKRQDELEAEIARLTAACDDMQGDMLKARDERDEARRVARVWYNAAGVWKDRHGVASRAGLYWHGKWAKATNHEMDQQGDIVSEYQPSNSASITDAGTYQFFYYPDTGKGYIVDTTRNKFQTIRVTETTDSDGN